MKATGHYVIRAAVAAAALLAVPGARAQQDDQVLRSYEQALAGNPGDLGIRYNLASAYYERGLFSRAVEQYREIAKLSPDDMAPHYNIGLIYYHQQDYARALEAFNRAHQLARNDDNVLYVMGMCHLALENYAQAITAMDMAVKLNPDNIDARINLANSYANSSRYREAVALYRDILQRAGKDEFVRRNFGSALYNAGLEHFLAEEYEQALVYLRESFTYMQDRRKAYLLAANSEFNRERYGAAIPLYRIVLEDDERSVDAHYYLAYSYLMVDSLMPAQRGFERVLELQPDHAKALKFKAELLDENFSRSVERVILAYQAKEYVEAWEWLQRAEELVPGHDNVRKYRALLQSKIDSVVAKTTAAGDRAYAAGDYAAGIREYGRVLRLDPMQFAVQARYDSVVARLETRLGPVFDAAERAMQDERYYDAAVTFDSVAAVLPGFRDVRRRLRDARAFLERETSLAYGAAHDALERKDYRAADGLFERLAGLNPAYAGSSAAVLNDRKALRAAMNEKQARVAALLESGNADIAAGRFWEARATFDALLKLDPENAAARTLRGKAEQGISGQVRETLKAGMESFRAQKFITAAGHFAKVLKLDPDNGEAARYGRICRAVLLARDAATYAAQKQYARAIATYRKARELDKDSPLVRDGLARAVAARDTEVARLLASGDELAAARKYREAEKTYRLVSENVSPGNAEAAERLKKLDAMRRGADNRATVDAFYSNGVDFYTRGEYRKAVAEWRKVLEIDPDHEKASRNIANARRKLEFMEK